MKKKAKHLAKEQRNSQRINFGFIVEEVNGERTWMTEDISSGGCFLRAMEGAHVGAKISLTFQLPGSDKYIEATGEVKHAKDGGVGIEFISMDNESKKEAARFVEHYGGYQEKKRG